MHRLSLGNNQFGSWALVFVLGSPRGLADRSCRKHCARLITTEHTLWVCVREAWPFWNSYPSALRRIDSIS